MKLLYALRFMTILPIPYRQDEDLDRVARSAVWFPFVGLIIGAILYGAAAGLVHLGLPSLAPTVTAILWIILTGGLHLDGLADTADGLGGGRDRERRLEIMKDSRIGSFGALTLLGQTLLKIACIAALIDVGLLQLLIIAPVAGRLVILYHFRMFPSARPGGMGEFFRSRGSWAEPVIGTLYSLVAVWYVASIPGLASLLLLMGIMSLVAVFLSKRLGGLTGDCYGATIELGETVLLLLLILQEAIL